MTLTGISAVRIPEGGVKSISVGGRTIWQKPVTERYTELEYIESTDAQYIDTGIIGKSGLEARIDYAFTKIGSTSGILFGALRDNKRIYVAHTNGAIGYGAAISSKQYPKVDTRYDMHAILKVGEQTIVVNGNEVYTGESQSQYDTGLPAYLFAVNNGGVAKNNASAKIYVCKIVMDGNLVRDFVPVRRNSDGAVGMYDRVSETFFGNAGTGKFIAGETGGAV